MRTGGATALKQLLSHGHHLQQAESMEMVVSGLTGSRVRIQPHFTTSVLSSAALTASYIRNWLVRNQESVSPGSIRRILALAERKHPVWKYRLDQSAKQQQYAEVAAQLELALARQAVLREFEGGAQEGEMEGLRGTLRKVRLSMRLMVPEVEGSLHPEGMATGADATGTGMGAAATQYRVRGLLVRVAGPRKGNRAMVWQRSVGAVSMNSVAHVAAEEAQTQLPSKLGTFGLYVRIVYQKLVEQPLHARRAGALQLCDGQRWYTPFQ